MGNIERWSEDELKRTLVAADGIDAEGFGATAGVLRELVFEIRRLRTTNRGAVSALRYLAHGLESRDDGSVVVVPGAINREGLAEARAHLRGQ